MNEIYTVIESPVGQLLLSGTETALRGLRFVDDEDAARHSAAHRGWSLHEQAFPEARAQLEEYFTGDRRDFDLPLELIGTEWELTVWRALTEIPYGQTRSYGEIARQVCTINASRAVGMANGRNPISIIVPCHRVIGASGSLTGYGGGLQRKRTLLDLESGRPALIPGI